MKHKPYQHQTEIIDWIADNHINKKTRHFLLDAPPGTGKSFLPFLLKEKLNNKYNIEIITGLKSLQDQYLQDFPEIKDLRGRNNYTCLKHETDCEKGNNKKDKCGMACPYRQAKEAWKRGPVSLSNFFLFNSLKLFGREEPEHDKPRVLFIDEAHLFEENICSFLSLTLSPRVFKQLGIEEDWIIKEFNRVNDIKRIGQFLTELIPLVTEKISYYGALFASGDETAGDKLTFAKLWKNKALSVSVELEEDSNKWVFEREQQKSQKALVIKPLWARRWLTPAFWNQYEIVVFMSGTILNSGVFARKLKLDANHEFKAINHPYSFQRRPVVFLKSGKLSRSVYDKNIKTVISNIKKIMEKHPKYKGVIHTNSYKISEDIKNDIKDKRLIFHDSFAKSDALQHHFNSPEPTCLVSPVMGTGIDFKNDRARFQIIVKMPFPFLGSTFIKKRLNDSKDWYAWKTATELIQSYGRGTRNKKDWCITYILDESFNYFYNNNMDQIPSWFSKAVRIGPRTWKQINAKK